MQIYVCLTYIFKQQILRTTFYKSDQKRLTTGYPHTRSSEPRTIHKPYATNCPRDIYIMCITLYVHPSD
jgi:hypothetical protein